MLVVGRATANGTLCEKRDTRAGRKLIAPEPTAVAAVAVAVATPLAAGPEATATAIAGADVISGKVLDKRPAVAVGTPALLLASTAGAAAGAAGAGAARASTRPTSRLPPSFSPAISKPTALGALDASPSVTE